MNKHRKNISMITSSVMVILLLVFSLVFAVTGTQSQNASLSQHHTTYQLQEALPSVVITSGVNTSPVLRIWIPNKDNFTILTFDKTWFRENKITNRNLAMAEESPGITAAGYFIVSHRALFPPDDDTVPPLLSCVAMKS